MFRSRRFASLIISATALVVSLLPVDPAHSADKDEDFDSAALKSIERLSDFIARTKQFGVTVDVATTSCRSGGRSSSSVRRGR